jgi:hypothetical protein
MVVEWSAARSKGNTYGLGARFADHGSPRVDRLIGRADELTTVGRALATAPLVTLLGPGGIGKTRLALAAAQLAGADGGDGVWVIELAGLASSGDVARAVADNLDVDEHAGRR